METKIVDLQNYSITIGEVLLTILGVIIVVVGFRLIFQRIYPLLSQGDDINATWRSKLRRNLYYLLIAFLLLILIKGFNLDFVLYQAEKFQIRVSTIFIGISILLLARILDWVISHLIINRYLKRDRVAEKSDVTKRNEEQRASRSVQFLVYLLALLFFIRNFGINFRIYKYAGVGDDHKGAFDINLSNIIYVFIIFIVARLLVWLFTQIILYSYFKRNHVDQGSSYAVNQIVTYLVYFIAIVMAINSIGINMTLLWGGLAALGLGLGLGLQQTFSDFFSGLILLFGRSVVVGDVIQLENNLVGKVTKIGIRVSDIRTADNLVVAVPNSKLTVNNVVNWSHEEDDQVRFMVEVGVAYGTDPALVKQILLDVAYSEKHVLSYPQPFVRFSDFGNSSLDFQLLFWTRRLIDVDDVKSDLRFKISEEFAKNNIRIPFPQMDVWIRDAQKS